MHEEGFGLELLPSGEPVFTWPDGRPMAEAPAAPVLAADPVAGLTARHGEEGPAIDQWATLPSWAGESLDLAYAVDAHRGVGDRQDVPAGTSSTQAPAGERPEVTQPAAA